MIRTSVSPARPRRQASPGPAVTVDVDRSGPVRNQSAATPASATPPTTYATFALAGGVLGVLEQLVDRFRGAFRGRHRRSWAAWILTSGRSIWARSKRAPGRRTSASWRPKSSGCSRCARSQAAHAAKWLGVVPSTIVAWKHKYGVE